MTPTAYHVREGVEAVIGERLRGAGPARNPYTPNPGAASSGSAAPITRRRRSTNS